MVNTLEFSQFASAGNLDNNDVTVGLNAGTNASFINPWTFLPPGNTAARPSPPASFAFQLRLNTDTSAYEYYNTTSSSWVTLLPIFANSAVVVTGATQQIVNYTNYVANNNSSPVVFTLPLLALPGAIFSISGLGSSGWSIAQNAGQNISISPSITTTGIGGSLASTARYDSAQFICEVANTTWTCLGGIQGILTIV